MLLRLSQRLNQLAQKWIPDPFVIALLLTAVTFAAAWALTDSSITSIATSWQASFWNLLAFSMQMCLILITGYALATAPVIENKLSQLVKLVRSPRQAVYVVCLVTMISGLMHWGLGLIVGALLARQMGAHLNQQNIKVHYPLLGAAGYVVLLVWHGGLSGSAPLSIATPGHFLEATIGLVPITQTLLSPLNLTINSLLLLIIPWITCLCHPKQEADIRTIDEFVTPTQTHQPVETTKMSLINALAGGIGLLLAILHFWQNGAKGINLNFIIWLFLFLALLLQKTPARFLTSIENAAKSCAGIILQFPFYAGIMGMMKSSGLIVMITQALQSLATAQSLPLFVLISASLVNLFVPSGGGQWAIQGPIIISASQALNSDLYTNIMALAYGDQLTNMLQPFWALALLGITGLKAKDIIGYTALLMMVGLGVIASGLMILS